MNEALLSVRDVAVHIGGLVALGALDLAVNQQQIVGLIGPNGAGKTTAFNVITGYMAATRGTVRFAGRDLAGLAPEAIARLGVVRTFQRTAVFAGCTVLENALTALHLRGRGGVLGAVFRPFAQARETRRLRGEALALLELGGLADRAGQLAGALAYGEQRRLGIVLALAAGPRLLLLDEPAAGLNASETAACMALIRDVRARGCAVLLVEHDMAMVMGISDHVVVLNQGRVIAAGAPAEVRRDPEVIRAYLGGAPRQDADAAA